MNDALVRWTLPTTRQSGGPLDPDDISGVEVSISSDNGANYTVADTVEPPILDKQFADLAFGDWLVRLIVIDTRSVRSGGIVTPFKIPDESPPGDVTDVDIVLT